MPEADLAARGYVAEEFFLGGTATSYLPAPGATLGEDGKWDAIEDGVAEFRTRILVVRPADPARCNGTAVVHWLNVTAGYEKGTADDEELLSDFVWVGVSAQQVGIDGRAPGTPTSPGRGLPGDPLKTWDPQRYGSLAHPGDEFSYDIFSQAGAVIRSGAVTGGFAVDRLVATGAVTVRRAVSRPTPTRCTHSCRCTTHSCRRSPQPVAPSSKRFQPMCRSSTPRGATSAAASAMTSTCRCSS